MSDLDDARLDKVRPGDNVLVAALRFKSPLSHILPQVPYLFFDTCTCQLYIHITIHIHNHNDCSSARPPEELASSPSCTCPYSCSTRQSDMSGGHELWQRLEEHFGRVQQGHRFRHARLLL